MFGSFKDILYLCTTSFIVLDMKVYTRSGAQRSPFFMSTPYLYIIKKIPPPLHSDRGNKMLNKTKLSIKY